MCIDVRVIAIFKPESTTYLLENKKLFDEGTKTTDDHKRNRVTVGEERLKHPNRNEV
jgi:hypothetical protein